MNCKDSDVFALERYIEKALNEGRWKNKNEIVSELKKFRDDDFNNWLRSNVYDEELHAANNKEDFVEKVMIRLCELFPMKYTKKYVKSNLNVMQNSIVFCNNSQHKLYFKRNTGF